MADTKTTALTENTTPAATDIMYIVDDPGGSAASQKITLASLFSITGRVLISEQTPTGTGTVTWSSIPATYNSLEIEAVARGTNAATNVSMAIFFNNDTTATNYRAIKVYAQAVNTLAALGAADSGIGYIAGASSTAGCCGQVFIKVTQYAGTTFNKQVWSEFAMRAEDATIYERSNTGAAEWESTAAINRVDLVLSAGNYDTGSTFRLYGVY